MLSKNLMVQMLKKRAMKTVETRAIQRGMSTLGSGNDSQIRTAVQHDFSI